MHADAAPAPYRTTPVFDEETLPGGLRREHRTKAGVWGLIRIFEGRLRLEYRDGTAGRILGPDAPGLVGPEQVHLVAPLGPMRMQVEFYEAEPQLSDS
ncbi:MAG TPA: DUF1971 domain-containing protein [Allosphingosinicella sp.]|jgi:tellurite resistance-related uncharacterized protein